MSNPDAEYALVNVELPTNWNTVEGNKAIIAKNNAPQKVIRIIVFAR